MIFIFAGRPGSGKTTIVKKLLEDSLGWECVKAITTRAPRANDLVGQYEHTDKSDFKARREAGQFILPVEIHGYQSAIKLSSVEDINKSNKTGVIVLEPYSVEAFQELVPNSRAFYIFVGNTEELRRRMVERGDDTQAVDAKLSETANWDSYAKDGKVRYTLIDNTATIESAVLEIKKHTGL
jgi:guanylate kinase